MSTRAIILAAGQGIRLKPYTNDRPKCLVELAGKPLLVHQTEALAKAGITDLTVVTGFRADQIKALGFKTVHNPDFATTNMVASLMCAAHLLSGDKDVLIAYSDIVYEPRIVQVLLQSPEALSTTVDHSWLKLWQLRAEDPLKDAETMRLNPDGTIAELGKKPRSLADIEGQYMGLIKIRADFAPHLVRIYQALDRAKIYDGKVFDQMFMTSFLQHMIDTDHPLKAVLIDGGWLEVDTVKDLELFNRLFQQGQLCLGL